MASRQFLSSDTSKWTERFGNGSDGAYAPGTGTDAPIDASCSGTITESSLAATNVNFAAGQCILIQQVTGTGVGNWELNKISSYTAGTITLSYALCNTYTDSGVSQAQVLVLKQYSSALIDTGVTLTAKAWNGDVGGVVAFLCNGTTTITGTTSADTKGYRAGSAATVVATGKQGGSHPNESFTASTSANGGGGGGGTGTSPDSAGGGAGGAYATDGVNGGGGGGTTQAPGGTKGASYGIAGLTTLYFGSAGGGGGAKNSSVNGAVGGIGGGIILIITKTFTIDGIITTDGGVGGNAGAAAGCGGGGAGGSVLIKSQVATLGTNLIGCTAGAGGTGQDGVGGAGSVGRIHLDYSGSYTGTTTPAIDVTLDSIFEDVIIDENSGFYLC